MMAAAKSHQLAVSLHSKSTRMSYEDVQTASSYIAQCVSNTLTVSRCSYARQNAKTRRFQAINGPLQQRTNILDSDYAGANTLPDDYDTDVESDWSNLSKPPRHTVMCSLTVLPVDLFADGNDFSWDKITEGRNRYYQSQTASKIMHQAEETMALLTDALKPHLNIGQNLTINTSSVILSLGSASIGALSNGTLRLAGGGRMHLPQNFNSNLSEHTRVSFRVSPLVLSSEMRHSTG